MKMKKIQMMMILTVGAIGIIDLLNILIYLYIYIYLVIFKSINKNMKK